MSMSKADNLVEAITYELDKNVHGEANEKITKWLNELHALADEPTPNKGKGEYKVTWEIELEASSYAEAAAKALEIQRDPNSTATVFGVFRENYFKEVDVHGR